MVKAEAVLRQIDGVAAEIVAFSSQLAERAERDKLDGLNLVDQYRRAASYVDRIKSEISRRRALSFLGLAAAFTLAVPSTMLMVSDAEALGGSTEGEKPVPGEETAKQLQKRRIRPVKRSIKPRKPRKKSRKE